MSHFVKLVAILILISPSISHATLFEINSSNSVVHTTNWSNWYWNDGLPDDVVDLTVQGTFEVTISSGGFNSWTGMPIPDRIAFTNINISSSGAPDRSWTFPEFMGFFFGPGFEGSSNPCAERQYDSPGGSCWSAGNYGNYQGTFDGQTINFTGGMNPSWGSTVTNGYMYEISAVAVPEPAESAYLIMGLGLIILKLQLSKGRRVKTKQAIS